MKVEDFNFQYRNIFKLALLNIKILTIVQFIALFLMIATK